MPYCPRCGEKLPEDARYCTRCGYRLKPRIGVELHRYWFRRCLAYLIDVFIVCMATILLDLILSLPLTLSILLRGGWKGWGFTLPLSTGVVQLVYFTVMEWGLGSTVGKQLLDLRVEGVHSLLKALIRNLTKLHLGILILDVIAGLLIGDPRRKFTDALSETWVVEQTAQRGLDSWRDGGGGDPLNGVGLGVLISSIGLLILLRPHLPHIVASWLMSCDGKLILPPREVLAPLLWLLLILSLWSMASSAVRLLKGWDGGRAMDDLLFAALTLSSALLIREHLTGLLPLHQLPPLLTILLGAAIAVYSLIKASGALRP